MGEVWGGWGQLQHCKGLFKSRSCCSLIELDEVFDRKSIKKDGALRQLQSAEGGRTARFQAILWTWYGKWGETHLVSQQLLFNITSGHSGYSALRIYHEDSLLRMDKKALAVKQCRSDVCMYSVSRKGCCCYCCCCCCFTYSIMKPIKAVVLRLFLVTPHIWGIFKSHLPPSPQHKFWQITFQIYWTNTKYLCVFYNESKSN